MQRGYFLSKIMLWVILMAIALGSYWGGYQTDWFQKKYVYPFPYQEAIYQLSQEHDLNPFLVAGVIKTESKFSVTARSEKNAQGLMQLMPDTALWVAKQKKMKDFSLDDLMKPEINLRIGIWYLSSLKQEFQGNEVLMLAAYNGGRGNVKEWMDKYDWTMEFAEVDKIPFAETRNYVKKVLKDKEQYQALYGK